MKIAPDSITLNGEGSLQRQLYQALRQPLLHQPAPSRRTRRYRQGWHLAALALLVLQLGVGLWLSLEG